MSKKGRQRRTPEQRAERRLHRSERGAGVFRYLTPEQAASPEFNQQVSETREDFVPTVKTRATNRAERRAEGRGEP